MSDIKAGDKVKLKTGKIVMIVGQVYDEMAFNPANADCYWEENGKTQSKNFPLVVLEKVID